MDRQFTDQRRTDRQHTGQQHTDRQHTGTEWSVLVGEFIWDIQALASGSISVGNSDPVVPDLVLKDQR